MEYLGEAVALGIDAIIFSVCCKLYLYYKNASDSVQKAPVLEINENLQEFVNSQPNHTLPYCALRGEIFAIGVPIQSNNSPGVTGVVQKLTINQHNATRSSAGCWVNQVRTLQEVYNATPFIIRNGHFSVEVLDALTANVLDLHIMADQFKPSNPSLPDHLLSVFSGVMQRGLQSTEAMLREGTYLTGIGELTLNSDGSRLILQPPADGTPYYLTTVPISSIVRRLEHDKRTYRALTCVFGSIGIVLLVMLARRWWKEYIRRVSVTDLRRRLELNRASRRRSVRDHVLPEIQLCVVCRENPIEIILLPCGHVCLCEDCSERVVSLCPVCRFQFETRAPAYIA